MRVTIAHLYYDLLNLYGECGNVRILKKVLEEQNIEVIVQFLTIDDELDFSKYDIVYMGMGIADNLVLVNKHLKKYKKDIKKYIEDNKVLICTGNSYELFGKEIKLQDQIIKTLGLFDYHSKYLKTRKVMEVWAESEFVKKPIIGFMNTGSTNDLKDNPFLININHQNDSEGIIYKNFIGSYIIGPLLIRNPHVLEKIIKEVITRKDHKYSYQGFDFNFLEMAYEDSINRKKELASINDI